MKDNREAIRIALEKCRVVQKQIAEELEREREIDRECEEREEREFATYGCVVYEYNPKIIKAFLAGAKRAAAEKERPPEKKE